MEAQELLGSFDGKLREYAACKLQKQGVSLIRVRTGKSTSSSLQIQNQADLTSLLLTLSICRFQDGDQLLPQHSSKALRHLTSQRVASPNAIMKPWLLTLPSRVPISIIWSAGCGQGGDGSARGAVRRRPHPLRPVCLVNRRRTHALHNFPAVCQNRTRPPGYQ